MFHRLFVRIVMSRPASYLARWAFSVAYMTTAPEMVVFGPVRKPVRVWPALVVGEWIDGWQEAILEHEMRPEVVVGAIYPNGVHDPIPHLPMTDEVMLALYEAGAIVAVLESGCAADVASYLDANGI